MGCTLPLAAYGVLKFLLSLGLLFSAGVFLQPCRKLMLARPDGMVEIGTLDPSAADRFNRFTGTLKHVQSSSHVADIDDENSRIFDYVNRQTQILPPLPHISLPLCFGSQIGGGDFEDITLYGLAAGTINGLLIGLMTSAAVLWVISWTTDHCQIPGVLGPMVFAMILLGLAFSGHFSPQRLSEMDIPIPSSVPARDEP